MVRRIGNVSSGVRPKRAYAALSDLFAANDVRLHSLLVPPSVPKSPTLEMPMTKLSSNNGRAKKESTGHRVRL